MTSHFEEVFKLMEKSFPKNEYRAKETQKKLLKNPMYKLDVKTDESGKTIAFIASWDFPKFLFIEHLAVDPCCRGKGTGSKIIKDFINNSKKPIVLEIEIPNDEISIKRKNFYEKLGFKLNNHEYYQLPLRKGDKPMKLNLMSYPNEIPDETFEIIENIIQSYVYPEF